MGKENTKPTFPDPSHGQSTSTDHLSNRGGGINEKDGSKIVKSFCARLKAGFEPGITFDISRIKHVTHSFNCPTGDASAHRSSMKNMDTGTSQIVKSFCARLKAGFEPGITFDISWIEHVTHSFNCPTGDASAHRSSTKNMDTGTSQTAEIPKDGQNCEH